MAFEFGGTFTASQFARLRDYARAQLAAIDGRISHLKAERDRIGSLAFAYDQGGVPTHMAVDPPLTYCGKLFAAYEALGGDVEHDLQVRGTSQPVFMLTGTTTRAPQMMSNGEVIGQLGLSDAQSAVITQKIKSFVSGDLQRRRDALERKIRRALDYAEQLDAEISQLQLMRASAETKESLEYLLKAIDILSNDNRYMAITNDVENPDPHGKFARAPIAAYMPGPKGASAATYERTTSGLAKPTI